MRRLVVATALLALLVVAGRETKAEVVLMREVLVDFEQYDDGENLNGLNLRGVTLSVPNGLVEIFDNRFGVYYHSATKAIGSPNGLVSVNPLVGVFDDPVCYVSLWGGDAGTYTEADSWELRAYDAPTGGNLVGSAASGSWNGKPYCELKVTGKAIRRFEAVWTGKMYGIGYDDLRFGFIPEPPVAVLASAALLILFSPVWRTGGRG